MKLFDYTEQGRRPTVAQIISAWKRAGKPRAFQVTYGETFAEFEFCPCYGSNWQDSGNGCRGVQRDKVRDKLNELEPFSPGKMGWRS